MRWWVWLAVLVSSLAWGGERAAPTPILYLDFDCPRCYKLEPNIDRLRDSLEALGQSLIVTSLSDELGGRDLTHAGARKVGWRLQRKVQAGIFHLSQRAMYPASSDPEIYLTELVGFGFISAQSADAIREAIRTKEAHRSVLSAIRIANSAPVIGFPFVLWVNEKGEVVGVVDTPKLTEVDDFDPGVFITQVLNKARQIQSSAGG